MPSLDALARERVGLHYGAAGDPDFAVNELTWRLEPEPIKGLPEPPRVTLYAQPPLNAELDLVRLARWLETTSSAYPPAPDQTFIPYRKRGIVDGIVAMNERGDGTRLGRFLAVRRTGSVEYGVYCAWSFAQYNGAVWVLHLQLVVLQFIQLLSFVDALASEFKIAGEWAVWCNARNVKPVVLFGFGPRWAQPFRDAVDISYPLEDHFQFEQRYVGTASRDATVREFATRFDFAFGSTKARAYDYPGDEKAALTFDRVNYT
jgi:hypothetical protein